MVGSGDEHVDGYDNGFRVGYVGGLYMMGALLMLKGLFVVAKVTCYMTERTAMVVLCTLVRYLFVSIMQFLKSESF